MVLLADLFMYNDRHNEANGEDNTDGITWNFSNNYGVEGPRREYKKFAKLKMEKCNSYDASCTRVPMILSEMSFEFTGRNNNAYCQDNEIDGLIGKMLRDIERNSFCTEYTSLRKSIQLLQE